MNFSLFFLFLLHFSLLQPSSPHPDAQPLLSFKSTVDTTNSLSSWNDTTTLCSTWRGVSCLPNNGGVSKLVLEDLNLIGTFPISLLSLSNLRVLSLSRNRFSGPLPSNFSSLSSLKLLFLSHNSFSGNFPVSLSSVPRLYRLDLSYNNLSGEIPTSAVNLLIHLLTLLLEENTFSGEIFSLTLSSIQDFNVSGNQLSGEIPRSLSVFPNTAFSGNKALCGPPLLPCKEASRNPNPPGNKNDAVASPVGPAVVVSSSPSSMPSKILPGVKKSGTKEKMSIWAIIAIILADVLVLLIIAVLLYCYFWRKINGHDSGKNTSTITGGKKVIYSNPVVGGTGFERQGRMVFFEGARKFEIEDLLRASAEMLGKGVFGTVYKAVLDDGGVVAVKRLKEAQVTGKKEFEEQMEVLGRLRHTNLVGLKAYYFARDEKLLVFDYMANGSLFWLLHGNRGPGRTPLDWTTRLKIASGAARGVAFIHNSCRALKLVHGNIKSTNILIDKDGNACVSEFGLSSFAPTPSTNPRSNGYRAPEGLDGRRLTQKADVYSFGVLLLELLTGMDDEAVRRGYMDNNDNNNDIDMNYDDNNVVDDDDSTDDESYDVFLDMMTCAVGYVTVYYVKHILKEPCMTSYLTGEKWIDELLNGHGKRCFNSFRMNQSTFRQLCADLESKYGLQSSDRMSILEKVGLFLFIISKSASNRDTQERFQHSGETISRVFREVLDAMDGLCKDMLKPRDPEFNEVPSYIANDSRYMPHFKNCIGALDGTHIAVTIPEEDQMRYRGRKGIPTINVLAVCDFDLQFIYVLTGWEGSAHDSRILTSTMSNPRLKFPNPPSGKYYLADKGYPEKEGILTPYSKIRYHQSEFRGAHPLGYKEIFNRAHSSLRSCIERAFGVLKARWKILRTMPRYSIKDQNRIILATFALHNYIRRNTIHDPAFKIIDEDPEFVPPDSLPDVINNFSENDVEGSRVQEMSSIRDNIATSLMASKRRRIS